MLLALAAFQAASVTFSAPTDTAARLLPRLSEAMGLRLETDRLAKRQVLLIQVRNLDRTRLLKLVSDTTGGSWETIDGGYRLVLGDAQVDSLWQRETQAREAWIERALNGSAGWALSIPEERTALASLAKLVGPRALANLRPGVRRTWSLDSKEAKEIANRLVASVRRRIDEFQGKGSEVPMSAIDHLLQVPANVVFAARRGRASNDVGFAVEIRAADGTKIVGANARATAPCPPLDPSLVARLPVSERPFSKETRRWASLVARSTPPDAEEYDCLSHPEKAEPLGLVVGSALADTAQTMGTSVVACLPDEAFRFEFEKFRFDLEEEIAKGVSKDWPRTLGAVGLAAHVEDGVLVAQPSHPGVGAEDRADRSLLRRRIADVERDGHLNFRYSEPYGLTEAHLRALPASFDEGLFPTIEPWGRPLAWNALTAAQRSRALTSGLSLREVPEFAKSFVQSWEPLAVRDPDERLFVFDSDDQISTVLRGGVLRARIEETPIAIVREGDRYLPEPLDYRTVAQRFAARETGPALRSAKGAFYPGVRQTVTLSLDAPGRTSFHLETSFKFAFRTSDVPSRYPNLFPALREAMRTLSPP